METAAAAREAAAMATQYAKEGGREPLLFTLSSLLFASYIYLCVHGLERDGDSLSKLLTG